MILIYNISGLLVALLGLFVGASLLLATGSVALGLFAIAGIWCWLGRSKLNIETGEKRPAPAIFFIPMIFWGILVGLAAFPALITDIAGVKNNGQAVAADPIAQQFKRDEAGLKTNESDAPELSAALVLLISEALPGEAVNVRVKSSADAVLVLMKLRDLKKISDSGRETLLEVIRKLVERHRPGVKTFVGIKGKLLYGAISTPTQPLLVGTSVSERELYAFYESVPTPVMIYDEADLHESPQADTPSQPDVSDSEQTPETETNPESPNEPPVNEQEPSEAPSAN
jgi:hypothetical protein